MTYTKFKIVVLCALFCSFQISCKNEIYGNHKEFIPVDTLENNEYIKTSNNREKLFVVIDMLPESTTRAIVKHDYYMLSYNEKYEQAERVAYELKKII